MYVFAGNDGWALGSEVLLAKGTGSTFVAVQSLPFDCSSCLTFL